MTLASNSTGAPRWRFGTLATAALVLVWSVTACAPTGPTPGASSDPVRSRSAIQPLSGSLTVYAAASLKKTFTELASEFESQHPGVKVSLNFDGSATLVTQIIQGAPADVFASADTATMKKLNDAGLANGSAADFASNVLTLVVPKTNPANITSFFDATRPGVKLVVCAPQVPCGAASKADAASAGLTLTPVSEELSVTSVLGKVTSGEADAGLVYVTDAQAAAEKITVLPLDVDNATVNHYPISAVETSTVPDLAQEFIALVTSPTGQRILQEAGFGAP